ncbi:MAG: hypothetical protein JWP63_4563 [Candidatus Solibacter sp.]|jgi:hypothetical protein|nr:hypothetical protein [Candidatus Solibacter sp.]
MRRTLHVCLMAMVVELFLAKAAASPVVGTWEGMRAGVKAATITVRETEGILGGSAIFYIIHDNASGGLDAAPTPAMGMVGTQWDGKVLRFSVNNGGGKTIAFELRVTGEGKGELRRPVQDGEPEIRVPMVRAR